MAAPARGSWSAAWLLHSVPWWRGVALGGSPCPALPCRVCALWVPVSPGWAVGLGWLTPRPGWGCRALACVCCPCSVAAVDRPALTFTQVGFRLGGLVVVCAVRAGCPLLAGFRFVGLLCRWWLSSVPPLGSSLAPARPQCPSPLACAPFAPLTSPLAYPFILPLFILKLV